MKAAINGKIFTKKLATFDPNSQMAAIIELAKSPKFVRFNKVELCYKSEGTIEEKCKLFVNYLHGIKATTLNGVNQIHFIFSISKMCFSDHLKILNYLRKELLPVCGTPRSYKFEFSFDYDYCDYTHMRNIVDTSGTNTIAQILQMHPIIQSIGAQILKLCFAEFMHRQCNGQLRPSQIGSIKNLKELLKSRRSDSLKFIRMDGKIFGTNESCAII